MVAGVAAPWIINRSLSFNARMTSFANIRFKFHAKYWDTFAILYLLFILNIVTVGLATPYTHKKIKEYFISKYKWGHMALGSYIPIKKLFLVFFLCVLVPMTLVLSLYFLYFTGVTSPQAVITTLLTNKVVVAGVLLSLILFPLSMLFYNSFVQISLLENMHASFNTTDTETAIDRSHQYQSLKSKEYDDAETNHFLFFKTTQTVTKTTFKLFGNGILSFFTMGLYVPFAIVNILKYSLSCLCLNGNPDLIAQNETAVTQEGSYAVDELANSSDLDIAI